MNRIDLRTSIKQLLFLGKEALFPRFCSVCHREGSFLCEACFLELSKGFRQSHTCGHCGIRETPEGQLCSSCQSVAPHDGIFAALHYDDPRIAHLIHLFKYRFVHDLGIPLGTLLATALLRSDLPLPDAILPVPLHPRRERWRGWNQAESLAKTLVKNFPPEITPPVFNNLLVRTRFTTPQMSLQNRELRKKNIEGAFQVSKKYPQKVSVSHTKHDTFETTNIAGKYFWIIDDVASSGSTIAACARALKERGARRVFGIVVAR